MTRIRTPSLPVRRPWLAFGIVLVAILIVISVSYGVRSDTSSPSWVSWVGVGLTLYGPVYALALSPRLITDESRLPWVQWTGAMGSFLAGWAAWFVFGASTWLLVLGVAATLVTLAALAVATRHES